MLIVRAHRPSSLDHPRNVGERVWGPCPRVGASNHRRLGSVGTKSPPKRRMGSGPHHRGACGDPAHSGADPRRIWRGAHSPPWGQRMSRFGQGRWSRITCLDRRCSCLGQCPDREPFSPASSGTAEVSEVGLSESIDAKQAIPDPLDQGLIIIRFGKGQTSQPAVQPSPTPPAPSLRQS